MMKPLSTTTLVMSLFKTTTIEVLKMVKPLPITAIIEFKYGEDVVQDNDIFQAIAHMTQTHYFRQ